MPTCGDCKFGVTGRCQDTKPSTGKPWDMIVHSTSYACPTRRSDSEEYADGERGFIPKEEPGKQQAITTLGQLLKKKLDSMPEPEQKKSCGTCENRKEDGNCYQSSSGKGLKVKPEWGGSCPHYVKKQHLKIDPTPARKTTCEDCNYFSGLGKECTDASGIHAANSLELKCESFSLKVRKIDISPFQAKTYQKIEIPDTRVQVQKLQEAQQKSTTTTKKETGNMNAIIRLADSQLNKQIEDFGGLSLDIRGALTELQDAERKESAKAAAKEVMAFLQNTNGAIEFQVKEIRRARRLEETAKKSIEQLTRAKAYGLETNNFIPLGILLGQIGEYSVENKDLLKVPADWQPKKAEVSTEAAAQ